MANTWDFDQRALRTAIVLSFARRGMAIPCDVPFCFDRRVPEQPAGSKAMEGILNLPFRARIGFRRKKAYGGLIGFCALRF